MRTTVLPAVFCLMTLCASVMADDLWPPKPPDAVELSRELGKRYKDTPPKGLPTAHAQTAVLLNMTEQMIAIREELENGENESSEEERAKRQAFLRGMNTQIQEGLISLREIPFIVRRERDLEHENLFSQGLRKFREENFKEGAAFLREYLEMVEKEERVEGRDQWVFIRYVRPSHREMLRLSHTLRQNMRPFRYDARIERALEGFPVVVQDGEVPTDREKMEAMEQVKGELYVMFHRFHAVSFVSLEELNDKRSTGIVHRILSDLETCFAPSDFFDLPADQRIRQELTELYAYTSSALVGFIDLRILMQGGSYN